MSTIVKMKGVTKRFPGVVANDNINFEIKKGEIHGLLGENGAGKTTLMNILYGLYQPDEGEIYVRDKKVTLKSCVDAINLKIGMVHQHFMLIPPMTVTENIILGLKSSREPWLDVDQAEKRVAALSEKYGFKIDPQAKVQELSVGEQQRVEIIKALYRGAELLILDEPTSVLTPQEVRELFSILRNMAEEGRSVIFITHKLHEVLAISNRITVLRNGKVVSTVETSRTNEKELARMMVGREVIFRYIRIPVKQKDTLLEVKDLWALSDRGSIALKGVSFSLHSGEILGIAGVDGNGQKELVEAITGLRKIIRGRVIINGRDMTNSPPREIIDQKVGYIPADRLEKGLVMDLSVAENLVLKTLFDYPFSRRFLVNRQAINRYAQKLISDYGIKTPSENAKAMVLSGGNLQRLVLAREMSQEPLVMVADQPTRGLDVDATEFVRSKLLKYKERGAAILLNSADLDEVLSMSDRISVMREGEIRGIVPAEKADRYEIGRMMLGVAS